MKRFLLSGLVAVGLALPVAAQTITVATDKSVTEATDALQAAVEGAGATVFARVDHTAGAQSAGLEMGDAQTLIFGNPKLGTPAMNDDIRASLFLPLKVAVYALPDGGAELAYENPADMFDGLDISADAKYVGMMTGALKKLTQAAAQ